VKRLLVFVLLVSLGLNVALALRLRQAAPPVEREWRGHNGRLHAAPGDSQAWRARLDRRFERLTRMLELDPEQEEAFRRLRGGAEAEIRVRMSGLETCRAALRTEAERQPPDPAAVSAALAAVGRAEAAIDSLVARNLQAELEILRPEQQSRLLHSLRFERLEGRGGPGSGRGRHHGRRTAGPEGAGGGKPPE